jgi:hypothetical protein
MSRRGQIIALSVVACAFGVLSLKGPHDHRGTFYAINVVLSIIASVLASIDLRRRGFGWGWLMLVAYLLPLVGTVLYVVFSRQRGYISAAQQQATTG